MMKMRDTGKFNEIIYLRLVLDLQMTSMDRLEELSAVVVHEEVMVLQFVCSKTKHNNDEYYFHK